MRPSQHFPGNRAMQPAVDPLPPVRRDDDEIGTMGEEEFADAAEGVAMIDLDLGYANAELGLDVGRCRLCVEQSPPDENLADVWKGLSSVAVGVILDVEEVQAAAGVEREAQGMEESHSALR